MRRADRLFRIVQILRRRRVVTAATLAERLEVSERTIYRDIADLAASGVAVSGEAGVGYRLERGAELPPLTFSLDEVEALARGARLVERFGDRALRQAARSVFDKVEAVLPDDERGRLASTALYALARALPDADAARLTLLRSATTERRKVVFDYRDDKGAASHRTARPLGLYFWGPTWTLAAYCELRRGFRNFRLDRIDKLLASPDTFELTEEISLDACIAAMKAR